MVAHLFGITTRVFKYSHTIGRLQYNGRGLAHPVDIALGKDNVTYTVNPANEDVATGLTSLVVRAVSLDEQDLRQFGRHGDGDGEFAWGTSIALDSKENVYVSDGWLNQITIFNKDGGFLAKWGTGGDKDGELNRPWGLSFDNEENLYVVDSSNHRVQKFTREGRFLGKFGSFGNGEGQLDMPWGITVDRKGDVYVADWGNDRIQKFSAEGRLLAAFGGSGKLAGQFHHPTDVAVDKDGDIYVADWGNHRVQIFTSDFRYITTLRGDSTLSTWGTNVLKVNPDSYLALQTCQDLSPWQRFRYPVALAVDDQNRVLVLDCGFSRIQIYTKEVMGIT